MVLAKGNNSIKDGSPKKVDQSIRRYERSLVESEMMMDEVDAKSKH